MNLADEIRKETIRFCSCELSSEPCTCMPKQENFKNYISLSVLKKICKKFEWATHEEPQGKVRSPIYLEELIKAIEEIEKQFLQGKTSP